MKNITFLAFTVFISTLFFWFAQADTANPKRELLQDIKAETRRCALQLLAPNGHGQKVIGYVSLCPTLKIISQGVAQIYIDGDWLGAKIAESPESDGGDLDDLYIFNSRGILLAKRTNIPAFDMIIVAMAGTTELKHR